MNFALMLFLAMVSGLMLKVADNLIDFRSGNEPAKFFFALASSGLLAWLIVSDSAFAVVGLAIVAGCVFSGKVDHPALMAGVVVIVFSLLFFDLPEINYFFLAALLFTEFLEEKFNWLADEKKVDGLAHVLLEKRLFFEVVALAISLVSGNPGYFLFILLFDLGYTWIAPKLFEWRVITL